VDSPKPLPAGLITRTTAGYEKPGGSTNLKTSSKAVKNLRKGSSRKPLDLNMKFGDDRKEIPKTGDLGPGKKKSFSQPLRQPSNKSTF